MSDKQNDDDADAIARLAQLLVDGGVLLPLFAAARWSPVLARVCRAWRFCYERGVAQAPLGERKRTRWIKNEAELAAVRAEAPLLALCVRGFRPNNAEDAHPLGINGFVPSNMESVHTLDLGRCDNVSDVSALGRVHTLNLSWCENVSDVSALGRVHTLLLHGCTNVSDVSKLGGVHTLDLSYCANVRDVSALGGVHTLDLRGCANVSDVSALGRVHMLYLRQCNTTTTDILKLNAARVRDRLEPAVL